ncbi:MAG: glycosyl hydrolase [Candidatus Omnitrophota bacterium]|nr:glycosyl hydrolase [Candidatus Omnitrophota bacterium]MDZ4242000.1 glycosyl hydrolase [Candidatus Omnitrophota bacterium]
MRRLFILGLLSFWLALSIPAFTEAAAKFEPADGEVLLFIGQDQESINDYVRSVKRIPAGFMVYSSVQMANSLDEPSDLGSRVQHCGYLQEKYPGTALQIGLYMVDALDGIVAGSYDANLDKMAAWFKKANAPVFLRIGYEFDAPINHYDPAKYAMAYRYIVDKFNRAGVTNVAYVWHSYASVVEGGNLLRWYPGDEYVDWVGISYFSGYNISDIKRVLKIAQDKGKPLMIAEATPMGRILSKDDKAWKIYFKKLFTFMEENNVKALSYINTDWDTIPMFKGWNWGDSRVQTNKDVLRGWKEEIKKDKYLHASGDLFRQIGF